MVFTIALAATQLAPMFAEMIAGGAMSTFGGGQSEYTLNGQTFGTAQAVADAREAYRETWLKAHAPVQSGEQIRLQSGRTTRISSFKQALPPRRRIYGTIDTGAPLLLHAVKSPYAYVAYALSDGPIVGVTHATIGGIKRGVTGNALTDTTLYTTGLLRLGFGAGDDAQVVDSMLDDDAEDYDLGKSATYRQQGVARMVCRLHYGDNVAEGGGARNGLAEHHQELWGGRTIFEFTVQGLLVTDLNGGVAYSANPANCLHDLLTCNWPGKISDSEIDTNSFSLAASDCDNEGFECHGVAYADDAANASIQGILSACDGALIRPDGKYELVIDKPESSVITLTDDDFTGPLTYSPDQALDDAPNILRATYGGGAGEVIVEDSVRIAVEPERQMQVNFEMVKAAPQARKLARRFLAKLNRPILPVSMNDISLLLKVYNVVTINSAALPEVSGLYKILSIEPDFLGAQVLLREYNANDYT